MIFKMETSAGWTWVDGVDQVQTYGYVRNPKAPDQSLELNFGSMNDLTDGVAAMWGDSETRSFDSELWPTLTPEDGRPMPMVLSIVLTRANHEQILALVTRQAFLLSEQGHTVERLAF